LKTSAVYIKKLAQIRWKLNISGFDSNLVLMIWIDYLALIRILEGEILLF